jgi:hypothetical protein
MASTKNEADCDRREEGMKRLELLGKKFGNLTVIGEAPKKKRERILVCQCACGEVVNRGIQTLFRGFVCRCGECNRKNLQSIRSIHKMSRSKIYDIYHGIKKRCIDKKDAGYKRYGATGITICERWAESFENFYKDMGPRPSEKHSVDRMDCKGNYEPSNCRWATPQQQARNRRTSNASGVCGVSFDKRSKKWIATIKEDKETRIKLGTFEDMFDAICARKSGENKYWKGCNA